MENIALKEKEYAKAMKEVFVILKNTEEEILNCIPQSFMELIEENMDTEYDVDFEYLTEEKMLRETKAIIALIYRDFLQSESAKNKNELKDEPVNYSELLNKNYQESCTKTEEDIVEIEVYVEKKWYEKLFEKIKRIWKKS